MCITILSGRKGVCLQSIVVPLLVCRSSLQPSSRRSRGRERSSANPRLDSNFTEEFKKLCLNHFSFREYNAFEKMDIDDLPNSYHIYQGGHGVVYCPHRLKRDSCWDTSMQFWSWVHVAVSRIAYQYMHSQRPTVGISRCKTYSRFFVFAAWDTGSPMTRKQPYQRTASYVTRYRDTFAARSHRSRGYL